MLSENRAPLRAVLMGAVLLSALTGLGLHVLSRRAGHPLPPPAAETGSALVGGSRVSLSATHPSLPQPLSVGPAAEVPPRPQRVEHDELSQGAARRHLAMALASIFNTADSEPKTAFNEGLDWVLGTATEVDGTAVGLAADPPAVLAVVSALLRTADTSRQVKLRSWLASVLGRFDKRMGIWERAQLHVAAQLLGEQRPHPPELSEPCCLTKVAVAPTTEVVTANDERAITAAVLEHHAHVDAISAAFLLAALSRAKASVVRSIRAEAMTIDDVLALLRNVTRSLRDWTWEEKPRTKTSQARQWHVDHEYHVQNLLWVVLAPLFPDLESEGYSAKVGFTQPRTDLLIPSLKLIIEAKFARATDSLKEIQRQLAQDAAMYFPRDGQYDRMIAFVWDDAARTEEHATLIQGLEKLERIAGVIVMNRPSKMQAPPVAASCPADGGGAS